jgi:hypothetical protein
MKKLKKTFQIGGKSVTKYFKSIEDQNAFIGQYSKEYSDKFNPLETWKPIPGFSRYEASTWGRLRSLNYKCSSCVRVITPTISPDGYMKTMLQGDNGKYRSWTVHLFVCLAFIGHKPKGLEVNHKDGIKINNSPDNLEYCTRSYNLLHAYEHGLELPLRGASNGNSKLKEADVLDIRRTAKYGGRFYGRKLLSEKYGISQAHVKAIVNNQSLWCNVLI